MPELTVLSAETLDDRTDYVGGIADALVLDKAGSVETVIDWKSDVDPDAAVIEGYRAQIRDYLKATGAAVGLLVFVTGGRIERVV